MKLRNKKTGKVFDLECITVFERPGESLIGDSIDEFYTIAELNDEWEDYTPAEPLIKDEKIRNAVRAWAEANDYKFVKTGYDMVSEPNYGNVQIHFEGTDVVDESEFGIHSIAELCGEEKE